MCLLECGLEEEEGDREICSRADTTGSTTPVGRAMVLIPKLMGLSK